MNIELTLVISAISVGAAVIFGISNFNNNVRKNAKEDGRILQDLDTIKTTVNKTDNKIDSLSNDSHRIKSRLAVVEEEQKQQKESFKRVHERIDILNEKVIKGGNQL